MNFWDDGRIIFQFFMKKILISSLLVSSLFFAGCSLDTSSEKISEQIFEKISEIHSPQNTEISASQLKKLVQQEQKNLVNKNAEIVLEIVENFDKNSENFEENQDVLVNVILKNPDQQEIQSVQAWFVYPVSILKGEKITLLQNDVFPVIAPQEQNFEREQGIVKLGFSVKGESQKTDSEIILAQIEFSKLSETPFQLEKFSDHIKVMTLTKNGLRNIVK